MQRSTNKGQVAQRARGKARQGVLLQLASRCLLLLLLHNANVPAIIQLSSI